MTSTSIEEKLVPTGTRCAKCYKNIHWGVLQDGLNVGFTFFCKECHLENKNRIKNGN
jgi:hypothetical protein